MSGPAKPCVDNVRSADGGSNRIPLASAIRETISDTRTSPVLLVGISMARVFERNGRDRSKAKRDPHAVRHLVVHSESSLTQLSGLQEKFGHALTRA